MKNIKDLYVSLNSCAITNQYLYKYIDITECVETTHSTNDYVLELLEKHTNKNILVVANGQTNGRGRKGREFYSPQPGLYVSMLFYPKNIEVANLQYVTICMCLAICEALEELYDMNPEIKWLNDIYINGKKLCGILTETRIKANVCEYIVVGFGMNIFDLPMQENLAKKVTSVEKETGRKIDRNVLLGTIVNKFEPYLRKIEDKNFDFIDAYEKRNFLIGKNVMLGEDASHIYKAIAIDEKGRLVVKNNEHKLILNAEEVSLYGWKN